MCLTIYKVDHRTSSAMSLFMNHFFSCLKKCVISLQTMWTLQKYKLAGHINYSKRGIRWKRIKTCNYRYSIRENFTLIFLLATEKEKESEWHLLVSNFLHSFENSPQNDYSGLPSEPNNIETKKEKPNWYKIKKGTWKSKNWGEFLEETWNRSSLKVFFRWWRYLPKKVWEGVGKKGGKCEDKNNWIWRLHNH